MINGLSLTAYGHVLTRRDRGILFGTLNGCAIAQNEEIPDPADHAAPGSEESPGA